MEVSLLFAPMTNNLSSDVTWDQAKFLFLKTEIPLVFFLIFNSNNL